jgi:hypothetical protein
VPGPSWSLFLLVPLTYSWSADTAGGVLAYVGLGPGQEFIPYFLGLVAWAMAALLAILRWPLIALFQHFLRRKGGQGRARQRDQ